MQGKKLVVEISGICNLKCAMCPRYSDNSFPPQNPFMSFDLFKKIIDRFYDEGKGVYFLELANWGEPLLHPQINEFIKYYKTKFSNGYVYIATNLNYLPDLDGFINSGVDEIRISLSGFSQEVYAVNNIGGNIEKVKENVIKLAESRDKYKKNVKIFLNFQSLKYNQKERDFLKNFCRKNKILFSEIKMFIPSVETGINYFQNGVLKEHYAQFIDIKNYRTLISPIECKLRRSIVIDYDGNVWRCCGSYNPRNRIGNFFNLEIAEIPNIRWDLCWECVKIPCAFR